MMSVKLSHHPDSNTSDIGDANRTFDALRQVWKAYCAEKVTTFHPLAATCMLAACEGRAEVICIVNICTTKQCQSRFL